MSFIFLGKIKKSEFAKLNCNKIKKVFALNLQTPCYIGMKIVSRRCFLLFPTKKSLSLQSIDSEMPIFLSYVKAAITTKITTEIIACTNSGNKNARSTHFGA
jgi:hypothetical protein